LQHDGVYFPFVTPFSLKLLLSLARAMRRSLNFGISTRFEEEAFRVLGAVDAIISFVLSGVETSGKQGQQDAGIRTEASTSGIQSLDIWVCFI
jgi:hypothetical protein